MISSVADTSSAYLLVTIEAKNDAAAAALMADDFENMDTFSVRALENEAVKPEPTPTGNGPAVEMPVAGGFSYGEKEALRTETSRTYSMRVDELNAAVYAVQLRLGLMEEGSYVEIPVELVEPVIVEVNAEGTGSGTFDHIEGGAPVTLETVSLSPLSIQMEYSLPTRTATLSLLFFRMTDGSLCGWGQIVGDNLLGPTSWNDRGTIHCDYAHPLRSVLELSQVDAVVFNGMAYPLDGGRPEPVEIDPALYPFQIPLMDRLSEGGGYSVPVRALCEGLGVDCVWSNEAQTAAMTYRGVTITLTPGSTTALVDGQPVEMLEAPAAQDGKLAACYAVFEDAWQVSMSAAYDNWPSDNAQRVAWLVIPEPGGQKTEPGALCAPGSVFAFSHSSRLSTTSRRVAAESRRASRSAGERGISRVSSTPFRPTTAGMLMHRPSMPYWPWSRLDTGSTECSSRTMARTMRSTAMATP